MFDRPSLVDLGVLCVWAENPRVGRDCCASVYRATFMHDGTI